MPPKTEQKIILVVRRTRLDELVARFNTLAQAKFYIEHQGADFSDYLREHQTYQAAVRTAENTLAQLGRLQKLERSFLPNFVFGAEDNVVVLGQDGLVANTVKYLQGQPVVGVNPDPQRWEGVLLPFQVTDLKTLLPEVFARRRHTQQVTMAQVRLNNGQTLYGVNDLFIGQKTHISARYHIRLGDTQENHSSSGIIVSTGLGSTGWFKSLMAGAEQIYHGLHPTQADAQQRRRKTRAANKKPYKSQFKYNFAWDANYLQFTVREPFPSTASAAGLVFGKITPDKPLQLVSQMAENGVIFSDGVEADFLEFNSGTQAQIGLADKCGVLVV